MSNNIYMSNKIYEKEQQNKIYIVTPLLFGYAQGNQIPFQEAPSVYRTNQNLKTKSFGFMG